ncbi:MAG: M23 family metallopeptidase [Deltaproteobacteria bacterium]|nr:M23 family metallopeptidase [Deltaproteobacteria bacterium]
MQRSTSLLLASMVLWPNIAEAAKARPPKPLTPTIDSWKGPKPPWRRRRRQGLVMRAPGTGLIDISRWPAEPSSPKEVDIARFARALRQLCGWMPSKRPKRYAQHIIRSCAEFKVDPFLLGGLIYRQSLCLPQQKGAYGVGLTAINEGMHRNFIRRKRYSYWVFAAGTWERREKNISRHLFYYRNLKRSSANIYFAAALLSIYREQMPYLGRAFGSVPYRHHVSHFIWGDRVRDAGPEDRVLRARRRLLSYYSGRAAPARGRFDTLQLHFPLDAPPRRVTSGMGDIREEGVRRHKGIDLSSTFGETVRAVADGRVIIAGIDARRGPSRNMSNEDAQKVPHAQLGPGGLYVMLRHKGGLLSGYMHLSEYAVQAGQKVRAGEPIGKVGRSGMKISSAHLHFELRQGGQHIDPLPHLGPDVFPPEASYLGHKLRYERWRKGWRKRRRARDAARRGTK